ITAWLGITLPPSRQRDDWSARPLTPAQLDYAAAAVRHLFALKERLTQELSARGRLGWVEEECAALAAQIVPERVVDPDAYLGVKGARELSPRGLAILRELWALRESLARAADRPPFKILSEEILLAIARAAPRDTAALATLPGVTSRVLGRWGQALAAAVERALVLPDADLPQWPHRPRPRIPGVVSRRVEALRKWRSGATERIGLEPGVLLPNRIIGQIAEGAPRTLGEALAATLADLREPADVVEIFRRPQFLPGHAAEIARLPWKPSVVWFQLGIRNDAAAETLARAGIRVVQDRCMMPEHRRLLGA